MVALYGRGVVDVDTPVLRADDLGVQRGDGVFETVRVHDGRPFKLGLHLDRLARSAAALDLSAPDDDEWRALVAQAVTASGDGDGYVKLVLTRGAMTDRLVTAFVLAMPMAPEVVRQRAEGVDAVTLTLGIDVGARADAPWLLGGAKTLSYAVHTASLREAEVRGAQDAIWLANDGTVLEAPTSTVCWITGDALRTPPHTTGILAGTTLAIVATLAAPLRLEVVRGKVDVLFAADEVFLVSSIRGVAGVRHLDGKPVGAGTLGPHTQRLRDAVEDVVAGRVSLPGVD